MRETSRGKNFNISAYMPRLPWNPIKQPFAIHNATGLTVIRRGEDH